MEINQIKALSKEERIKLAAQIRRDPELRNAVNGIGGLSENAAKGLLQGTISDKGSAVSRIEVSAKHTDGTVNKAKTNQYGYFTINLKEGTHTASVTLAGVAASAETVIVKGKTLTFDHDFGK